MLLQILSTRELITAQVPSRPRDTSYAPSPRFRCLALPECKSVPFKETEERACHDFMSSDMCFPKYCSRVYAVQFV